MFDLLTLLALKIPGNNDMIPRYFKREKKMQQEFSV